MYSFLISPNRFKLKLSCRIPCLIIFLIALQGSLLGQEKDCDHIIKGIVIDLVTKEPLPFATVSILETGNGVTTDNSGAFLLEGFCDEEVHLEVRFIGYKSLVHHHDLHHSDPTIYLAPDETLLESIIVEASRIEAFRTIAVKNLKLNTGAILTSSIGDLTERMSGIYTLKTGINITKPIVHGLHSNRVLVMNDGLRHAYQVWGDGHAPEIDPSHVDEIEVVKGAGTVKYGPEALGGVILYNSKKPEIDKEFNGSFGSSYQLNGNAYSGQLSLEQGSHRFAWNASGFGIRQGDLRAPDYYLTNTGKSEFGASFNTLFHFPKLDVQISGSYLDQNLGILRGSLVGNLEDLQNAIERAIPNPTFDPSYQIQNPKHETQHSLLKSKFSIYLGEHIFKILYGVQLNDRKEFDVRRGELNNRPIIDLKLLSHSLDAEWIQPLKGIWDGNSGIQIYTQNSTNAPGSNPINFIPNYKILNVGAYSIQSLNFENSAIELGVRYDQQTLNVVDTIRDVAFYSNEVKFKNATFTLGYRKRLNDLFSFFSNIGTAWRPPNVSELYSFGYHFSRIQFGLWRYELNPQISTPLNTVFDESTRQVPSERSLKWVSGIEFTSDKVNSEWVFHVNRINDYIFLRPFGISTNIAGTFPFFIYSQTNALFVGSDLDLQYSHNDHLSSEAKISYVFASEIEDDQSFIEIPPLNINYSLEYTKGKWEYAVRLNYMAEQWKAPKVIEPAAFQEGPIEINPNEIFDFMKPPEDYLLLGAELSYKYKSLKATLGIENLLNSSYRSYTDRLRYFSDAPGRNVSLRIDVAF